MKVLIADSGWKMRGGQWQSLYLAEGLREHGHEVSMLARHGSLLWDLAHRSGFRTRQIGLSTMLTQSRTHDVVHVQDSHSHTVAALTCVRQFFVSRRVAFPAGTSWASRRKYQRAACFLAVSQAAAKELKKAGVADQKIRVVFDGVPDIAASRIGPHIAGLRSDDPWKMNLLMRQSCELAQVELILSESLPEALKSGLLFLYLSENEGLGSAVLLAMAAGMPIVTSRVGGLPEAVDNGFSGLVVPNDRVAVAQAIHAIRDDRNLALRFSENARRRYLENFTLDHMVRNTLAVYKEFLNA